MNYATNPGPAVTHTPKADKEFLVEYRHAGSTWGLSVWADDWKDAERKLRSLATNGRVIGECAGSYKVPEPLGPIAAFLARLFGAKP